MKLNNETDYVGLDGMFLNEDERFILSYIEECNTKIHPRFEEKYNMNFNKAFYQTENYQRNRIDILNCALEQTIRDFKVMYRSLEKR